MKNSSFKTKSPEHYQKLRQEAIKRSLAKKKLKMSTVSQKDRKPRKKANKRQKLPAISTMRNKCDKLLTPIIKILYPLCLLHGSETCAYHTQVAHHHVHKSKSNRLRYELTNLIPLCNSCHLMLHNNESFWASKVVYYRGLEWFEEIERMKNETVKTDVHWYIENYNRLKEIYDKLSTNT